MNENRRLTGLWPVIAALLLACASAHAADYPSGRPHSTDNDDSCDIALLPAATLLLPYFEVDLKGARLGETTIFSVTNVSEHEVVAHVTLWTDYAYPVLDFNIFLTGYDIQSIDLYDVIAMGQIAPFRGTGFEDSGSPQGDFSSDDRNPLVDETTCRNLRMQLHDFYRIRMQRAFTRGEVPPIGVSLPGCTNIGGTHARAVGYATVDVTSRCDVLQPEMPEYYRQLLFDNILTGEYHQVNRGQQRAQSAPMVHIRAVPEGGTLASRRHDTNLERTFYSRYLHGGDRRRDARQPLPSVFAARWVSGEGFATGYKIWREGIEDSETACGTYSANSGMEVAEIVRFDDDENAVAVSSADPADRAPRLAATSFVDTSDGLFPQSEGEELSGWMYLNLDRDVDDDLATQAWVVSSMQANGTFSVDSDVVALGNGCTPPLPYSAATSAAGPPIGPAPNDHAAALEPWSKVRPRSTGNDDSCDISLLPAATLLLPYFEVDYSPGGKTTLFTVVNVSPRHQAAKVTIWTDHRYPILGFHVELEPYDARSINLYDVLAAGRMEGCDGPLTLPAEYVQYLRTLLTTGIAGACRSLSSTGPNAKGFVTIDVVEDSCSGGFPDEPQYYDAIAFDNVLTGDYQYVDPSERTAAGNPLVHIRAVPEGGNAGTPMQTNLPATFYDRHLPESRRYADRRQPLPSTFVAPWADYFGPAGSVETSWVIWRNGESTYERSCGGHREDDGSNILIPEIVRFDNEENAIGDAPRDGPCTCPAYRPATRTAGRYDDDEFLTFEDEASGWLYFNLGESGGPGLHGQAWVSALRSEGSITAISDAVALGNGCSPEAPESEVNDGRDPLGPAPNGNP
jgi:hypothetical protein